MKIYVDTREQLPIEFEGCEGVSEVIRTKLPYGDYAAGWEDKKGNHIAFMPMFAERKGLGDLFGTLTSGIERFKREIERAKEDKASLVIFVEGCFREVQVGAKYSTVDGETILKTLHTLWVKYDVPYVLCNDREDMRDTIIHFFSAIGRNFKPKGHEDENKDRTKEGVERSLAERKALVGESSVFGCREPEETGDNGQEEA